MLILLCLLVSAVPVRWCYVALEIHSDLDNMDDMEKPYVFVLISSVLTWARSKPVDPVIS